VTVIQSSPTTIYSYNVDGETVTLLGVGDHHDAVFDLHSRVAPPGPLHRPPGQVGTASFPALHARHTVHSSIRQPDPQLLPLLRKRGHSHRREPAAPLPNPFTRRCARPPRPTASPSGPPRRPTRLLTQPGAHPAHQATPLSATHSSLPSHQTTLQSSTPPSTPSALRTTACTATARFQTGPLTAAAAAHGNPPQAHAHHGAPTRRPGPPLPPPPDLGPQAGG